MKTRLNDLFDRMDNEEGNKLDDKIMVDDVDLDFDYLIEVLNGMVSKYNAEEQQYLRNKITKKYSSKQITKFSLLLNDEHIEKLGNYYVPVFLNFLINNSKDKTHNVHTSHLSYRIDDLGYKLEDKIMYIYGNVEVGVGTEMKRSKIVINGDGGYETGYRMNSGEILVKGNCEFRVGLEMGDGLIEVEGNCDNSLAMDMYGGKIIVRGNAGQYVGLHMEGGVVRVYGDIASLSKNICGGNIYHKDKLIVKNGEILDKSYKVE